MRIGQRTDKSVVVERLLSISGEDIQTVPRKYIAAWTGKLATRIIILTNELPALTEGSGALANRFIIIRFIQSFLGREDPKLTDKLLPELPGILNWAIEGYHRLCKRGHFVQPENAKDLLEQLEHLGSPTKAFLSECCVVGPNYTVEKQKLYDRGAPGARKTINATSARSCGSHAIWSQPSPTSTPSDPRPRKKATRGPPFCRRHIRRRRKATGQTTQPAIQPLRYNFLHDIDLRSNDRTACASGFPNTASRCPIPLDPTAKLRQGILPFPVSGYFWLTLTEFAVTTP